MAAPAGTATSAIALAQREELGEMAEIVLGVTGSIAAYKAAELVRVFIRGGHGVHVVMTKAATEFVTPLTFRTLSRNPVAVGMFDEPAGWEPRHVSLASLADVLVIAPCTANVLAKLAHGIADDELTATALACRAPLVVAPAMNNAMFAHPATQANLGILRERGVTIAEPEEGELACGATGQGRLAPVDSIAQAVFTVLGK